MAETPEWIGTAEAEKLSGVSRRQLARLAAAGAVERRRKAGGAWEYRASDCESHRDARDVEPDGELLLGQAYGLIRDLTGPVKAYCSMLIDENAALRKRIERLEDRQDEMLTAREELLNMKVDRDMALSHQQNVEARKERAFRMIESKVVPKLLSGLGGPAARLLDSLTEEQLTILLSTDMTDEHQKKIIRDLVVARGGKLLPADADTGTTTTEGASDGLE